MSPGAGAGAPETDCFEAPDPGQTRSETSGHGEHVVNLDDDEILRLTVERLLQRAVTRVSCYLDGHSAVDALHSSAEWPDRVVTDFEPLEALRYRSHALRRRAIHAHPPSR